MRVEMYGVYLVIHILLLLRLCVCLEDGICDRRPLGTTTEPLAPDNQFQIEIKEIRENLYIPKRKYDVRLFARDNASSFIAFSISLGPDSLYNKDNPRKPIILSPGSLEPESDNAVPSRRCNNTIIQSDITPKKEVKVKWMAPLKDNKCVTIYAVVAVQPDVWYNFEGPLSKRVCEDSRKSDDMLPMENSNCQVCMDARYQVTFQGMWSPNTHPTMYPETKDLARFSDIVGASHSKEHTVFKISFEASQGLKLLAEQGNTTNLEMEILKALTPEADKRYVRTLIKASAPARPDSSTLATFRVTQRHHLVSLATALLPSPDWFLGVSNLELCNLDSNKWAERVTINLYPFDAGTDSGKTFESANEATSPPQPIKDATIAKSIDKDHMKPFARLVFDLVRTYMNPNCPTESTGTNIPHGTETTGSDENDRNEQNGGGGDGGGGGGGDGGNSDGIYEAVSKGEYHPQQQTTTTSEEPPAVDPETQESQCPMTTWGEWDQCEGECVDNKVSGYHTRYRKHAVDSPTTKCLNMTTVDFEPCEEDCQSEEEKQEEEYEEEEGN